MECVQQGACLCYMPSMRVEIMLRSYGPLQKVRPLHAGLYALFVSCMHVCSTANVFLTLYCVEWQYLHSS